MYLSTAIASPIYPQESPLRVESYFQNLPLIPDFLSFQTFKNFHSFQCIPLYLGLHTGSQKRTIRSHPYHSFPKLGTEIMPCSLEKSYRGPRGQPFQKYGSFIEMLSDWCDKALGLERRHLSWRPILCVVPHVPVYNKEAPPFTAFNCDLGL